MTCVPSTTLRTASSEWISCAGELRRQATSDHALATLEGGACRAHWHHPLLSCPQEWEATLWAAAAATQTTDRNEHHRLQFNGYEALPAALGRTVELG